MLDVQDFSLAGPDEVNGMTLSFTRYRSAEVGAGPQQLSLFFLHAVGSHKEAWLPTIEQLFELQASVPNDAFSILEAWTMDCPNHGRSASLNDMKIHLIPEGITGRQWAAAAQTFLTSGLIQGTATVGIGHSAGSCIVVQATDGYALNSLPFLSIILVEPGMLTPETLKRSLEDVKANNLFHVVEMTKRRKDIWPSRSEAKEWLAKRPPWRSWDPRVLDLYVENGLRDLPTYKYPDLHEGVTLATGREQETAGYMYHEDGFWALNKLKELCPILPVHTVFGGRIDMISPDVQEALIGEGRTMKSVVRVSNAGHLVAQENPEGLALALWGILHEDCGKKLTLSKL